MNTQDLIKKFGTQAGAADAINVSRQGFNRWHLECNGRIPLEAQVHIEVLTNGRFRADLPKSVRNGT